jgi:hypothetical protein
MRKHDEFATPFWRRASKSLPPHVRQRYRSQLKYAERLDLTLDRVLEFFSLHRPTH